MQFPVLWNVFLWNIFLWNIFYDVSFFSLQPVPFMSFHLFHIFLSVSSTFYLTSPYFNAHIKEKQYLFFIVCYWNRVNSNYCSALSICYSIKYSIRFQGILWWSCNFTLSACYCSSCITYFPTVSYRIAQLEIFCLLTSDTMLELGYNNCIWYWRYRDETQV